MRLNLIRAVPCACRISPLQSPKLGPFRADAGDLFGQLPAGGEPHKIAKHGEKFGAHVGRAA
jgi:hypothetical protein